jgi:large subunit ribosomal protein L21
MFAIFETGGKQYKAEVGKKLLIEKLDAESGSVVNLENLMLLSNDKGEVKVGSPTIAGASIKAEIISQTKADKVIVFKKKRRHNYRRKNGHRQKLSFILIKEINCA